MLKLLAVLAFTSWAVGAAAQVPYPTPTSREKLISVSDINYLDALGRVASIISNIRLTIIEEDLGNGAVQTYFAADYGVYNKTWDLQGTFAIVLDIRDAAGNVVAPRVVSLSVDRNSCTYGGARPQHQEGWIAAAVFKTAQSGTLATQTPIGRYSGPC